MDCYLVFAQVKQLLHYLANYPKLSETSSACTQPSVTTLIFEHFAVELIDSNQ